MKIISPGNTAPKTYTCTCRKCGCVFEFEEKDAKRVQYPRDGEFLIVNCPQPNCGEPHTTPL